MFIFFSWTTGSISTKLCKKHPWVKGNHVCSNEGSRPFPRWDNTKLQNYIDEIKKKPSSQEPPDQFQPNLSQIMLGWRETKLVQIKGLVLFQGEIITKKQKYIDKIKKKFSKNHGANFNQTWHNASLGEGDSSLFKWRTILIS